MNLKNRAPLYGESLFVSFVCYPGLNAWGFEHHFTKLKNALLYFNLRCDLESSCEHWWNELSKLNNINYYRIRMGFDLYSKSLTFRTKSHEDLFAHPVIYIQEMESPRLKLMEQQAVFLIKSVDKMFFLPCKISSIGLESLFIRKFNVDDFLWTSESGMLLESSSANIFILNQDENSWYYPDQNSLDNFHVYSGITQEFFKQFLLDSGIKCTEKNFNKSDFKNNLIIIGTNAILGFKIINPIVGKIIKDDLKLKSYIELVFHQFHQWLEKKLCKISLPNP